MGEVNFMESMSYKDFDKFVPLPHGHHCMVIKVYDGDSFTIGFKDFTGEFVRCPIGIFGIDTPEMRSSGFEKKIARKAKKKLSGVILGKMVVLIHPTIGKRGNVICDLATEAIPSIMEYMLNEPRLCRPYISGKKPPWVESCETELDISTNCMLKKFKDKGDNDYSNLVGKNIGLLHSNNANRLRKKNKSIRSINMSTGSKHSPKHVNIGESAKMKEINSISISFGESEGVNQKASLILSDDSEIEISYDETNSDILVDGYRYVSGESFILDGKKVTFIHVKD